MNKSPDEQMALICRGVEQIETRQDLHEKLRAGKPLRIKYGIDPTGIDVHLGHTVPLRKLQLFQELGHQAVIIIGDYTALIGDPSGRDETRQRLTPEQVKINATTYLSQISKVVDLSKAEIHYNSEWFDKFSFLDTLSLTSKITVQRILERDDFTKRKNAGIPISLHECLYPLMQGYDSVMVKSDVELGGSEQLFSLLVGRDLQRDAGQTPQSCITLPILRGLDGERRMGKSLKNYVGLGDSPYDQFAKIMSIPDNLMVQWFELLTDCSFEEIVHLTTNEHPMKAKKCLGHHIVRVYHQVCVHEVQTEWESRVSRKEDPNDIPEFQVPATANIYPNLVQLLVMAKLAPSNSEARRLIEGGAVSIGDNKLKLTDPSTLVNITDGMIVRCGKRNIVRLRKG